MLKHPIARLLICLSVICISANGLSARSYSGNVIQPPPKYPSGNFYGSSSVGSITIRHNATLNLSLPSADIIDTMRLIEIGSFRDVLDLSAVNKVFVPPVTQTTYVGQVPEPTGLLLAILAASGGGILGGRRLTRSGR